MTDIRCGQCRKLLAKVGHYDSIEIKCPRCGTLNHQKAESLHARAPASALTQGSSHA